MLVSPMTDKEEDTPSLPSVEGTYLFFKFILFGVKGRSVCGPSHRRSGYRQHGQDQNLGPRDRRSSFLGNAVTATWGVCFSTTSIGFSGRRRVIDNGWPFDRRAANRRRPAITVVSVLLLLHFVAGHLCCCVAFVIMFVFGCIAQCLADLNARVLWEWQETNKTFFLEVCAWL